MKITGSANINYYFESMIGIFESINKLTNYSIHLIKVKAHSNNVHNNTVDLMAKKAALKARAWKETKNENWDENATPAIVSIAQFNEMISIKYEKIKVQKWRKFKNKSITKRKNRNVFEDNTPHYDYLFLQAMWVRDDPFRLNKNGKYLRQELTYLSTLESEVINKLRTETANLNDYKANIFHDCSELCSCDNDHLETVQHYLIDCELFKKQRHNFRKKLCKIDKFFKQEQNFMAINILFPHRWQIQPRSRDSCYKKKSKLNINRRVNILKQTVQFVLRTKRFDCKYGI